MRLIFRENFNIIKSFNFGENMDNFDIVKSFFNGTLKFYNFKSLDNLHISFDVELTTALFQISYRFNELIYLQLPFYKKENKFFIGALGGAAGGALMGGPLGAILGGVVGSVAHGTGFDKKIANIGKWPGKALNTFSDYLTRKEIQSGNGFNWTAGERLAHMERMGVKDYTKTSQGRFDTQLAKSSRVELVKAEMYLRMATGGDPELDNAVKKAYWHIDTFFIFIKHIRCTNSLNYFFNIII